MSIIFDARELASWTLGRWIKGEPETLRIRGFSNDTRNLKPGQMFLALATETRDGHSFLEEARAAGAQAALVARPIPQSTLPQLVVDDVLAAFHTIANKHRHRFPGIVIGITGSCGKTSTKELLKCLLGSERTHATYCNYNNLLGVPLTLTGLDPRAHKYGIIEAGTNRLGELPSLAAIIKPDIALTTLIADAHLEGLGGSLETIAQEKVALSSQVMPGGVAVFPESCLNYLPFKRLENTAHVVAQRNTKTARAACVYEVSRNPEGKICLTLQDKEGAIYSFYMRPLSAGMLSNAALAIWIALSLGVGPQQIQERLGHWKPVEYRGELLHKGAQYFYADCYSGIPTAFYDSLAFFQEVFFNEPRHLYILGAMGELGKASESLHYALGAQLKLRKADQVIVVGQEAEPLVRGLIKSGNLPELITFVSKTEEARPFIQNFEGAIFLKGKNLLRLWELLPEDAQTLDLNNLCFNKTQPC